MKKSSRTRTARELQSRSGQAGRWRRLLCLRLLILSSRYGATGCTNGISVHFGASGSFAQVSGPASAADPVREDGVVCTWPCPCHPEATCALWLPETRARLPACPASFIWLSRQCQARAGLTVPTPRPADTLPLRSRERNGSFEIAPGGSGSALRHPRSSQARLGPLAWPVSACLELSSKPGLCPVPRCF